MLVQLRKLQFFKAVESSTGSLGHLRCQWVNPRIAKVKTPKKSQISFCQKLENRWYMYHVKVLPKRFYLNGLTVGFHPQSQKLEPHFLSL